MGCVLSWGQQILCRILAVQWKISVAEPWRCNCPVQMQLPKPEFCKDVKFDMFMKCAMKLFPKSIWKLIFKNIILKTTKPQNYWKSWNLLGDFPAPTMPLSHLWWDLSLTAESAEQNPILQLWLPSVNNSLAWGGNNLHSLLFFLIKCFPLPPIPLQTYSNKKHI